MSPIPEPRPLDVVVAGLAVVDVIGRPVRMVPPPRPGSLALLGSVTMTTGGNVLNTGIDLAKLGFRVGVITRVGDDGFGAFLREEMTRHGLETGGLVVDRRAQTSATIVCVDRTGERTFFHVRGCLRNFRTADVLGRIGLVRRAPLFALGYYGLLAECEPGMPRLFRALREEAGVRTLLDTGGNPRRNDRLMRALLPHVDYFIPSHEESAALTGQRRPEAIVRRLRALGAAGVLGVKLGARGAYIDAGGEAAVIPPRRVRKVLDATGAGDAFVAGFLAATARGRDPFEAARIANAVAADCVTAVGASTAIRSFEDYAT